MNNKIIIDTIDNNLTSEEISTQLYNKLLKNNYDTLLLDNNMGTADKIQEINQYGERAIVISIEANNQNTTEIIYSLYFDNTLPTIINANLGNILDIAKYYQLRLPSDTSKDYYQIVRETPYAESIVIKYQIINNTLIDGIVNALYNSIKEYILEEDVYTVKTGDTLYGIARKYDVNVNDLIKTNNLGTTSLYIGQELIIPKTSKPITMPSDYEQYTVKTGDTLYKIANTYNTTINDIKTLNNLQSNTLSIGQILNIPNKSTASTQYVVKQGDSLYKIASNYNTTVNEIKRLNNLQNNLLSIGQILILPTTSKNIQYTVKQGDSLYKIANTYNTTVDKIKSLNNLQNNLLSIGQILTIPQ